MKTANEITANAIYKILGQNCWAVPSDSSTSMYKVCFSESASNWECTCRHGEVQASRCQAAHCKHVAAVQISIKANMPAKEGADAETFEHDLFISQPRENASDELYKLPLNGSHERKMETAPSGRAVWMR